MRKKNNIGMTAIEKGAIILHECRGETLKVEKYSQKYLNENNANRLGEQMYRG